MKRNVPLLFLLPSVLVMLGIAVYPVGFGLWASFHQWNWAIGQADHWFFNGLDNYLRLFQDAAFCCSFCRWRIHYGSLLVYRIDRIRPSRGDDSQHTE